MHAQHFGTTHCIVIIPLTEQHIWGASARFESICIYKPRWLVRLIKCVKVIQVSYLYQRGRCSQNKAKSNI